VPVFVGKVKGVRNVLQVVADFDQAVDGGLLA
jgi:hypothetical protein